MQEDAVEVVCNSVKEFMDELCSNADVKLTEKDCKTGKDPIWTVADCKKQHGKVVRKLKENPTKAVCDIFTKLKIRLVDSCEKKVGERTDVCMKQVGWQDEEDKIIQDCDTQDEDDDITSSGYIINRNEHMFCMILYMFWIYVYLAH